MKTVQSILVPFWIFDFRFKDCESPILWMFQQCKYCNNKTKTSVNLLKRIFINFPVLNDDDEVAIVVFQHVDIL